MRLLNITTRQLELFEEPNIPPYAILSHRWEEEEVFFADVRDTRRRDKKGFRKLSWTCAQASRDRLGYVWIDTCCIDKSSSVELSEAINSMFSWYNKAHVCYAYLSDVHPQAGRIEDATVTIVPANFCESVWFSRGWTLQELLAPEKMQFFGYHWCPLGSRDELQIQISKATGIDRGLLSHRLEPLLVRISRYSIAQKMSWAAKRQTTRIEDRAYSLLGLFNVNMPLLYGEGNRAFMRLQEELLKAGVDLSIFAWQQGFNTIRRQRSLLASDPDDFVGCHDVVNSPFLGDLSVGMTRYRMTHRGLKVERPRMVYVFEHGRPRGAWAMSLECRKIGDVLGMLALKIDPLEPIIPVEAPSHHSKASTINGQDPTQPPPLLHQPSTRKVECYVGWAIEAYHQSEKSRTTYVNGLKTAISPHWESLILMRDFIPSQPLHLEPAFTFSHIWLRPPDDNHGPPWVVRDLWPPGEWNARDLTLDLGWAQSNGSILRPQLLPKDVYAAAVLTDPLMGFTVSVHMRQRRWSGGDDHYDVRSEGLRIALNEYNADMYPEPERAGPYSDSYSASSVSLKLTNHLTLQANVRGISRAGILIAEVTVDFSPKRPNTGLIPPETAKYLRQFQLDELSGPTIDSSFFESHIAEAELRRSVERSGRSNGGTSTALQEEELLKLEERSRAIEFRYEELLQHEQSSITARKTARYESDAAVARWVKTRVGQAT